MLFLCIKPVFSSVVYILEISENYDFKSSL